MIKLDLAGVRLEDVRVSMQGNTLTVEGIRRDDCIGEDCTYYLLEISYSRFRRSISLPEEVERFDVQTEYRNGMLLIRLGAGG